jgi:hypothetical protein
MSTYGAEFQLSTMTGRDGVKIIGEEMAYGAGSSVSAASDVNGDGFDDIIVGAQYADLNGTVSGAAYVVFGRSGGFGASLDLATLNGVNGFRTIGETAGAYAGTSVAAAGDLNGDGFDDVIIGANPVTANGVETGAAYVIFGYESAFDQTVSLSGLDGMNGFQIGGGEEGEFGGYEVSAAVDINSDGIQDVIIAGSYYDE